MAEQSSEWEKNRALSISQGGTGKQIGEKRAQMYLAEGGVLKMQYADYPAMPIADLTGRQESAATVPTGAIFMWMASAPPEGYVMCDGTSYTTIEQPRLFGAIGTQFGQTGGAGTFNVPNLAGRVPVGAGTPDYFEEFGGSLSAGAKGGDVSKELTERHLPEHRHSIEAETLEHSHTVPSHTHARGSLSVAPHTHSIDVVVSDPYAVDETTGAVDANVTSLSHSHGIDFTTSDPYSVDASGAVDANVTTLSHSHGIDVTTSDPYTVDASGAVDDETNSLSHSHGIDFTTSDPFLISYDSDGSTRYIDNNANDLTHDHDPTLDLSSTVTSGPQVDSGGSWVASDLTHDHDPTLDLSSTVTSGPKVDSSGSWVASDLKHRHYGVIRGDAGDSNEEFLVGDDATQGANAIVYSGATPNDWLNNIQDSDNPAVWHSSSAGVPQSGGGLDGFTGTPSTTHAGAHAHAGDTLGVSINNTLGVSINNDLGVSINENLAITTGSVNYTAPSLSSNGAAALTGSVDGSITFAPDSFTEDTTVDFDASDDLEMTSPPYDDTGNTHNFTDRYTAIAAASAWQGTYSSMNTLSSYNTNSQSTPDDGFNDHSHYYYETILPHSHQIDDEVFTSWTDDSNLGINYTPPTLNAGSLNYTAPTLTGGVDGSISGAVDGSISGSVTGGLSGAIAAAPSHEHGLEALSHTHSMATDEAVVVTNEHELDHVHSIDVDNVTVTSNEQQLDHVHSLDVDNVTVTSNEYELNHAHKVTGGTSVSVSLRHAHKITGEDSGEQSLNHVHKIIGGDSGEASLRHTHKIDSTTGNQQSVVYLNAIGATDTPVEADSDDGELTTSTSGGGSIGGFTGLAGEAMIEKLDVKQPYLVVNWIMKT